MIICGINFNQEVIQKIEYRLDKDPQETRRTLARDVCEWLSWYNHRGEAKISSCLKAFSVLNEKEIIIFPKIEKKYSFQQRTDHPKILPLPIVSCELSQLGEISLEIVKGKSSKSFKLWREAIQDHHYLKNSRTCGSALKYLVKCSKFGVIGALTFSSSKLSLKDRDDFIGWSGRAKKYNINKIVNNSRFVILPTVNVKNLASKIFSIVYNQLPSDWEMKYDIKPIMLETFVNPELFKGTCYKASGWSDIGDTSGRRDGTKKKIFIKHLNKKKTTIRALKKEPAIELCKMAVMDDSESGIKEELSRLDVSDSRLREQGQEIVEDCYSRVSKNAPQKSGSLNNYKSTMAFFNHKDTSMEIIISSHAAQTVERIKEYSTVLLPQDTTTLNYTHQSGLRDYTPINEDITGLTGFFLHATLATTTEGTPLGVVDANWHGREPKEKGCKNKKDRHQLHIRDKESYRWITSFRKANEISQMCPDTTVISVGDSEGDIFDLLDEASKSKAELLVRHRFTSLRTIGQESIVDLVSKEAPAKVKIELPKRGNRKARKMIAEVRYCKGLMDPPQTRKKEFNPIPVSIVEIKETSTPPGGEPSAHWILITTLDVSSDEEAIEICKYYKHRWKIETFFKTIKSGCKILNRQSMRAETLSTAIAIDLVVAWRVMHLTMMAREYPNAPCTEVLSEDEYAALKISCNKDDLKEDEVLSLGKALTLIAMIGGYFNRRSDPPPGVTVVWRGIEVLKISTEFYEKVKHKLPP